MLTSVLYAALGVVLMIFPGTALRLACTLIGLVTLGYGLTRVLSWRRLSQEAGGYSQRFDLFLGVVLGLLGLFLLVTPQVLVSIIPVALGLYVLVDSVSAGKRALDMKALGYQRWWAVLRQHWCWRRSGRSWCCGPSRQWRAWWCLLGWALCSTGSPPWPAPWPQTVPTGTNKQSGPQSLF